MAGKTISEFTDAGALQGSDYFLIDRGSSTLKLSGGALSNNLSIAATGSTTARTLASHFSDSVSPLNFGAVGDGTTDDRAALKLALES